MSALALSAGASSSSQLVCDLFFSERDICRTTELCVRALNDSTSDPLSAFGNTAIRTAVSCTLTTEGLAPFSSDLRVLIRFADMTAAQLHALRAVVGSMTSRATMRYRHNNGGLVVSCRRDSPKVFANAALVLFALNVLILRAVTGQAINVEAVINITQQRIIASINVHRSQLVAADKLTREYIAANAANAV
jgi:hypothetical protein